MASGIRNPKYGVALKIPSKKRGAREAGGVCKRPPIVCIGELRCREGECRDAPCMGLIDAEEVRDYLMSVV